MTMKAPPPSPEEEAQMKAYQDREDALRALVRAAQNLLKWAENVSGSPGFDVTALYRMRDALTHTAVQALGKEET